MLQVKSYQAATLNLFSNALICEYQNTSGYDLLLRSSLLIGSTINPLSGTGGTYSVNMTIQGVAVAGYPQNVVLGTSTSYRTFADGTIVLANGYTLRLYLKSPNAAETNVEVQVSLYDESTNVEVSTVPGLVWSETSRTLTSLATPESEIDDLVDSLAEILASVQSLIPSPVPLPAPTLDLATVKVVLQFNDTTYDALLTVLIPVIEDIVAKYCGVASTSSLSIGSIFPICGLIRYAIENPVGAKNQQVGNDRTEYGDFPNALLKLLDNFKPDSDGGYQNPEVINLRDINRDLGRRC